MKTMLAVLGFALFWPALASADIYRCVSDSGVRYSDEPCGDDSERIEVRDNRIGGNFGQNLPAPEASDTASPGEDEQEDADTEEQSTCRYINSTDLRRYLIREQVVQGMTQQHVLDAFGRPQETYPTPQQTWVYETKYYGALYELTYVYFKDGCVEEVVYRKP